MGLFGFVRRDHNQYIHLPQSIWNRVARYFILFYFFIKNQITEDWFLTLVKCCFCEEWRHYSSEVLLFYIHGSKPSHIRSFNPHYPIFNVIPINMSQWEKDPGLFGCGEERPQSIHTFALIHLKLCGQIFYFFFLKESDNRGLIFDFSEVLLLWSVTTL